MPKPVDGIDCKMKTIVIFNPSEIVFKSLEISLKRELVRMYGSFNARLLLFLKKKGVFKKYTEKRIQSADWCKQINTSFLNGAEKAMENFSGFQKGSLEFIAYLNVSDEKTAKKIINTYSLIPCMSLVSEYVFPRKNESISDIFSDIKDPISRANYLSLVTDLETAKLSKEENLIPVIISQDQYLEAVSILKGNYYAKDLNDFSNFLIKELGNRVK